MKKLVLAMVLLIGAVYGSSGQRAYPPHQGGQAERPTRMAEKGVHRISLTSPDGLLELRNQSQFQTIPDHANTVRSWRQGDRITFCPNTSFWGDSEYYVTNLDANNEWVKADLVRGPNLDNPLTDRLERIDEHKEEIILNNSRGAKTRWKIDSNDFQELLKHWRSGDVVIIGKDNSWFSRYLSDGQYILVSYEAANHVLGVHASFKPL